MKCILMQIKSVYILSQQLPGHHSPEHFPSFLFFLTHTQIWSLGNKGSIMHMIVSLPQLCFSGQGVASDKTKDIKMYIDIVYHGYFHI